MKYKIKITYDTGDSFHTEYGIEKYLEEEYTNLSRAETNLNRIKEHYEYYRAVKKSNYYYDKEEDKRIAHLIKDASNQPWYVSKHEYCLILIDDNNTPFQIGAFWCGYFEKLVAAEIVNNLPKITFQ